MSIHLKLIIATFFWGLTPTLGKILATLEAPFIITFGRFLFACLWLFPILILQKERVHIDRAFLKTFVVLGFTGIFLHNVLMYKGLEYISASIASLIFAFIVAQVAVIDAIIYRKLPSLGSMVGIIMSVFGIIIVVTGGDLSDLEIGEFGWGIFLVFGSALSWAVYTVVSRRALQKHSPLIVTSYASLAGLALTIPFPMTNFKTTAFIFSDANSLLFVIFLGVVSSAITFIWHHQAIKKLGVLSTSIYLNLMPIFGVLSAAVILGETIDIYVVIGGVLVICGIVLVNLKGGSQSVE